MMIGTETAAMPKSMMGLRKDMLTGGAEAEGEVGAEDLVEGVAGVHEHVVTVVAFAAVAEALAERFHFAQVAFANLARARQDFWDLFESFELNQPHEWKLQFVRVHDVKGDHFVAAKTQVLNAAEDGLLIVEEIADQDDNAFSTGLAGHVVEDGADVGLRVGLERGEARDQIVDSRLAVAARRVIAHIRVKQPEGHGVALIQNQIGEAG